MHSSSSLTNANGIRCFTSQSSKRQREETTEDTAPPRSKPDEEKRSKRDDSGPSLGSKMLEAAATSLASILVLAIGFGSAGYLYHKFYKHLVLKKMANAFEPGDPVLELAAFGKGINMKAETPPEEKDPISSAHWIQRPEQAVVDQIVMGQEVGHCESKFLEALKLFGFMNSSLLATRRCTDTTGYFSGCGWVSSYNINY